MPLIVLILDFSIIDFSKQLTEKVKIVLFNLVKALIYLYNFQSRLVRPTARTPPPPRRTPECFPSRAPPAPARETAGD